MPAKQYDDLVIGGGIIGLACAYYLVQEKRSVCVIDQSDIGAGASHGNCGLLFFSHLLPLCSPGAVRHELARFLSSASPLYIAPTLCLERLLWLYKFARNCNPTHLSDAVRQRETLLSSSRQLYNRLLSTEALDCEWEENGVLMVYRSKRGMESYVRTNAYLAPYGLAATPYVGNALRRLEPALTPGVYGGWYHRTDAHLRPDRLMAALKSLLQRKGVDIIEHQRVNRFKTVHRRITRAVTAHAHIEARYYVLTSGAWCTELANQLKVPLPVQAGKGYSLTMRRPKACPQIPCMLSDSKVVATPWSSGYRLGGTLEFSGINSHLRPERIGQLRTAARDHFVEPVGEPVLEQWVGMRSMTPDDLPIIDRTAFQNLVVATGHGTTGLSMATATGKLVSEMLTGQAPHIDLRPFSLDRFG